MGGLGTLRPALVKLRFLGTPRRDCAAVAATRLRSSILAVHRRKSVMIGCGLDWLEGLSSLEPEALFLTYGRERGVRAAIADDRLEVLLV